MSGRARAASTHYLFKRHLFLVCAQPGTAHATTVSPIYVAKILTATTLYILLMWSAKSAILREAIQFVRHKQV